MNKIENHYLKNFTVYCKNKNSFISFIDTINIVFFEYLNIDDIVYFLESLYYFKIDIDNIILLFINYIINTKHLQKSLEYLYNNCNNVNHISHLEQILNLYSEKRTIYVLDIIKNHKHLKKNNTLFNNILILDDIEYMYTHIFKVINYISYTDEENEFLDDIIDQEIESSIRIQYHHELNQKIVENNKDYKYIYDKIGLQFPTNKIYAILYKHNSVFLHNTLDKLNDLTKLLKTCKNIIEFKQYYEDITGCFYKLPLIENHTKLNYFEKYYYLHPELQTFVNTLFIIDTDVNNNIDNLKNQINNIKKIINDYEYIYIYIDMKNTYNTNIKINHSLENVTLQYRNNEFDFDISIESISLFSLTKTINDETDCNFILTESIKNIIKEKYINQFYNFYNYKIAYEIIYRNDYVVYNYLKYELSQLYFAL